MKLPNLAKLGLAHAAMESTGQFPAGFADNVEVIGAYGHAEELSSGKILPVVTGKWLAYQCYMIGATLAI